MEHRNGCTGNHCEVDEFGSVYPPCWTREQVAENNQRTADVVRLGILTEGDRVNESIERIKDSIELERMRHDNEMERLEDLLARAEQQAARMAQSRGISDR